MGIASPRRHLRAKLLQPGNQQVASGYILYGSSTVFVLTTGEGVDMFVYDPTIGDFLQAKRDLLRPMLDAYRRRRAAIEGAHKFATSRSSQVKLALATLCRHRGDLLLERKALSQKNFR